MCKGLALEGNVAVGLKGVKTVLDKPDEIFKQVEDEEDDEEQFALLVGVNCLMGDLMRQESAPPTLHEDDAEEVDAMEVAWWEMFGVDDAHGSEFY